MTEFLRSFVIDTGILLILSTPTLYLAWRKGRNRTLRRVLIAAGSVGLLTSVISGTSTILVNQCRSAIEIGPNDCVDYGSTGMRLTFIVVYVIVIWAKAATLLNE